MGISLVQAVVKIIRRKSVAQPGERPELTLLQTMVPNSIVPEEIAGLESAVSAGSGLTEFMELARTRQVSTNLIANEVNLQKSVIFPLP